jgi:hypothetical protein
VTTARRGRHDDVEADATAFAEDAEDAEDAGGADAEDADE